MDIEQEIKQIVDRRGPWTAHNLRLAEGVYTIGPTATGDEVKLRRVVQVIADLFGSDLAGRRALDLACLEGMYSLELARRGAEVVGIEGREVSIEKARFAGRSLRLDDVTFVQDDVRNLSRDAHGTFDIVLCLGILYHLDVPDVFRFVEQMADVCTRVLVVDTHVAPKGTETHLYKGHQYMGVGYREHDPGSTPEQRSERLWASLDNPRSFWPTRSSLLTLLAASGFTSVLEVHVPSESEKPDDRITLVALRGTPETPILTVPPLGDPAEVGEVLAQDPTLGAALRLSAVRAWRAADRRVRSER